MKKFKQIEKSQSIEKNDLKYSFISSIKLNLGYMIAEANKIFSIDEKQALELKSSIFFKKGSVKEVI